MNSALRCTARRQKIDRTHLLYFARDESPIRPTVFLEDTQVGDTIPVERLPQTL